MANINFTSMLRTTAADGKLAKTDQLYDDTEGKFQTTINAEVRARLETLSGCLRYMGSVSSVARLPKTAANGAVYNVAEDGNDYAAVIVQKLQDTHGYIDGYMETNGSYKYSDAMGDEYIPVEVCKIDGVTRYILYHAHTDQLLTYNGSSAAPKALSYCTIGAGGYSSKSEIIDALCHSNLDGNGRFSISGSGGIFPLVTLDLVDVVTWDSLGPTKGTDLSGYYNKKEVEDLVKNAESNLVWQ